MLSASAGAALDLRTILGLPPACGGHGGHEHRSRQVGREVRHALRPVDMLIVTGSAAPAFMNVPDALSKADAWRRGGGITFVPNMGGDPVAGGRMFVGTLALVAAFERDRTP